MFAVTRSANDSAEEDSAFADQFFRIVAQSTKNKSPPHERPAIRATAGDQVDFEVV